MFVLTVLEWVEVNYVSPCCFMVITTFLQLFFHTLYYCIKKSSTHFKPVPFINILWNLVSLWSDILCYMRIFYFPKLFNKLRFCYITFLFPKTIQQNMICYITLSFAKKTFLVSNGVVSIFQTLYYCDKITLRSLKIKGTLTMFEEKFLRP